MQLTHYTLTLSFELGNPFFCNWKIMDVIATTIPLLISLEELEFGVWGHFVLGRFVPGLFVPRTVRPIIV